ncbi:MAG: hypothetical protein LBT47_10815 [Deltaproteobacteria bacterium]|jgi:DNA-directed RNA polymerase subunit RPC12/RpoP|nr:hypothetical protein [Deltaproteobacteria bacterium]
MEALTHITCDSCGAQVELVPGQTVLSCPYCGSAIRLVKEAAPAPIIFDFVIPTDGNRNQLRSVARQLMIAPESAPDDILDKSNFEQEIFWFLPFWLGSGSFVAHWSASFGFDRQETYTDYVTRTDSKGRNYREAVTRTRTVIDWRPASGTATGKFRLLKYAGDQSKLPPQVVSILENPSVLGETVVYSPALLGGLDADSFMLPADDAVENISQMVEKGPAATVSMEHAKGQHQQNWAINAEVQYEGPLRAGFVPVARTVFSYKNTNYELWHDGRDLERYWYQNIPVDPNRAKKKALGFWPLYSGLIVSVVAGFCYFQTNYLKGAELHLGLVSFTLLAALIFGTLRSRAISGYSKSLRNKSLAQKKLEEGDQAGILSDSERKVLFEQSRPVTKPRLANTASDRKLIPILILIVLGIVTAGFGRWPFFLGLLSSNIKTSSQVSAPSRESSPPRESASSSPSSSASAPKSQSNVREAVSAQNPPPSDSAKAAVKPSSQSYDIDRLVCRGQPSRCVDSSQVPVKGLVYKMADNGRTLEFSGFYSDGLAHGITVYYTDEGLVARSIGYKRGVPEGLLLTFHPPAKGADHQELAEVASLKKGEVDGLVIGYDQSGILSATGQMSSNQEVGTWYQFHPDGSVKASREFELGKPKGPSKSYPLGEKQIPKPKFENQALLEQTLSETVDVVLATRKAVRAR